MSFKVKALYDYASTHEDDLPFSSGQIITVTDEDDADWYGGEYIDDAGVKQEGIFPRNFVEKFEPTAPPRPTRTRPKKEAEPAVAAPAAPEVEEAQPEPVRAPSPVRIASPPPAAPVTVPEPVAPKPPPPTQVSAPTPPVPQPAEAPAPVSAPAPKAAPPVLKPSAASPPPVAEKTSGNSFKDRIAAFNKAAAPPVAPFKPSGLSSGSSNFIKKPFVAPPPSRHAYVPPPTQAPTAKLYRRDEDPEIKEQEAEALENAGKVGLVPAAAGSGDGEEAEDQPKPMSLKERLALLQKQQAETAARHAEAAAKKEKPKKPAKKRLDGQEASEGDVPPPLERRDTGETAGRQSVDESHPPRLPHPPRRKSSRGFEPNDGNEADYSGAGEMTEGQEDLTEKEDSDGRARQVAPHSENREPERLEHEQEEAEEEEEEEEEEDVDPEVRRKEELRARMAKMSGGMGMPGMAMPLFGAPAPVMPKKKKPVPESRVEEAEEPPVSPTARAPPVPLPGLSRPAPPPPPEPKPTESEAEEEETSLQRTPHQEAAPSLPTRELGAPPPVPGGRPAPPPVPADSRPPPPPPSSSAVKSPSEGSASDDELSEQPTDHFDTPRPEVAQAARAPPPPPPAAAAPPPLPPSSPRADRQSYIDDAPASPPEASGRRLSRAPPPVPASAPALPPMQARPPPLPPTAAPPRRESAAEIRAPPPVPVGVLKGSNTLDEEVTEYEGDYDTDIASSVPHKDALKSHQRESSFEDVVSPRSPTTEAPPIPSAAPPIPSAAPPIPSAAPPRGPPPIPSQPAPVPTSRKSTDIPRGPPPPPPPPPPKETPQYEDDEYDPYNYSAPAASPGIPPAPSYSMPLPPPHLRSTPQPTPHSEEPYPPDVSPFGAPHNARAPPPPPPSTGGRNTTRQSLDVQRPGASRRSVDVSRPSIESGFVANDIDLASQSGWWLQPNSLPPQLQGRKDIFSESEESTSANARGKTIVTRDVYVLFQDYSQTVITVRFDPQDASDVHLEQRHEPPPRALRQDQLEQSYERFGRTIGETVASKKDTVVGDGTPQGLVYELLRPFKDALLPVGTRAYGALVYSNLANASTSQNDEIRPGDIMSIRNAKFQGKHGAMHAKYSMEVGKPDHVAVVAEWDGTKKKVRAWEQGRESKKVKLESFKLDDLRSGEVKIWRVMPRSWVGWEGGN